MIFYPKSVTEQKGSFVFSNKMNAFASPCLDKPVFCELWRNFTYRSSSLTVSPCDGYLFSLGRAEKLPLEGADYTINIQPEGICVYAESEKMLIRGFMTLLDRIQAVDTEEGTGAAVACCQIRDRESIKNRMVHYCVFPETSLRDLQRFVRFCGALKYTHIVLEFWGMLKLDCMKELAWGRGFTKEQVRPIIAEANALGMEVIPMFNHWGHASACRVAHGKHVVLDQNPTLQTYFSEDGWCWDIRKPKVRELLRKIRRELTELCGEGQYFHMGCDEAYNFAFTEENMDAILAFINGIGEEMNAEGRRVMVWGDMFLYRHGHYNPKNRYTCNAPTPEAEAYLLERLNKNVIVADWQYHSPEAPVETCSVFLKAGFDCCICPWDRSIAELESCITTAREQRLLGVMHTTWHTLSTGMPFALYAAVKCVEENSPHDKRSARTLAAALMRKVLPSDGEYENGGWATRSVFVLW